MNYFNQKEDNLVQKAKEILEEGVKSVTLTKDEARIYDSGNDKKIKSLMKDLTDRFGPVDPNGKVEVFHPDGFVVNTFRG